MRRLLLFDIDGTLVAGGPAKEAFREALVEAYGTTGAIELHDFAGKTDPQIARELLRGAGLDDPAIDEGLPTLWELYLAGLADRLPATPMEVLPGASELVAALEEVSDVALGLVTGNIVGGAKLKLGSAGLGEPFTLGGFGSDSEERDDLPPVAVGRARERFGVEFRVRDVVIVGDTPRDVGCGRCHGFATVAVATGRFTSEQLRGAGADRVVDDFRDTGRMVELLTGPLDGAA